MGDDDLDLLHAGQYRGMTTGVATGLSRRLSQDAHCWPADGQLTEDSRAAGCSIFAMSEAPPSVRMEILQSSERKGGVSPASKPLKARGHDVRTAGTAGADMVRVAQARARSMVTGTGLLTMSRTGE